MAQTEARAIAWMYAVLTHALLDARAGHDRWALEIMVLRAFEGVQAQLSGAELAALQADVDLLAGWLRHPDVPPPSLPHPMPDAGPS